MKLALACLVVGAALATQDTTPPVISLHLAAAVEKGCPTAASANLAWMSKHNIAALNCPAPCYKCEQRDRNSGTAQSVTCEVEATKETCAEPTARVFDHHQAEDEFTVKKTYELVNVNGQAGDVKETFECKSGATPGEGSCKSGLDRGLRSEWLIRYGTSDLSGNHADEVSFTMIFQDTQAPLLKTEFGLTGPATDRSVLHTDQYTVFSSFAGPVPALATNLRRDFAESCWENKGLESGVSGSPCMHTLESDPAAKDRYDSATEEGAAKVQATLKMQLVGPGKQLDASKATKLKDIKKALITIDTQHLGTWTVGYWAHDFAGQFGYLEAHNRVHQKVSIQITDNHKPAISLNKHQASQEPCDVIGTVQCQNKAACGNLAHMSCALTQHCTKHPGDCHNPMNDKKLTIECNNKRYKGSFYVEPRATCFDARESWVRSSRKYVREVVDPTDPRDPEMAVEGTKLYLTQADNTHTVKYQCDDLTEDGTPLAKLGFGTPAGTLPDGTTRVDKIERVITIVDTRPPVIKLKPGRNHRVENSAGQHAHDTSDKNHETQNGLNMASFEPTAETECKDTCREHNALQKQITATLYSGSKCTGKPYCATPGCKSPGALDEFPEYVPGEYSIKYVCTDGTPGQKMTRNTDSLCVRITNVDYTKPILQLLGADEMTLEATHEGNYVDDGATCFDQVDGVISQNVEVSGDVVNLSKVGTYTIAYHCKDAKGNTAEPLERIVHVVQNSCPRCTMRRCETKETKCTMNHEASFVYTDAGVTCSDVIDGQLKPSMIDTLVNGELDGSVNVEKVGKYIVTYRAHNSAMMYNDYETCKGTKDQPDGGAHYMRTVNVVDTLKPVVEVRFKGVVVGKSAENPKDLDRAAHSLRLKNPAYDSWTAGPFPSFMAEAQSSANAWVLAAAAAAVAGIALLGMSQRRVVTSVPV